MDSYIWNSVWKNDSNHYKTIREKKGQYKLDIYKQLGVEFSKYFSICDTGCGVGTIAELIFKINSYATITGYDKSRISLSTVSETLANNKSFSYKQIDFESESIDENTKYDMVISFGLIEHLQNPTRYLRNIEKNLKTGGVILLTVSNRYSICRLQRLILTLFGKWPFGYQQEYTKKMIEKLFLENTTLSIKTIQTVPCDGGLRLISLIDRFNFRILKSGRYLFVIAGRE